MSKNPKPNTLLTHLQFLTEYFPDPKTQETIPYINIYAEPDGNVYKTVPAVGEGISCVDDVSRAAILALELFEFFGDIGAKEYALELLKFIEYMTDGGQVINFIYSDKGERKLGIPSSYRGGAWWSARAKWALAKAYRLTSDTRYLDRYRAIEIPFDYGKDVASVLLLAELELESKCDDELALKYISRIITCMKDGYFLHTPGEENTHTWGYHELEAIAKASRRFPDRNLLSPCISTMNSLVKDLVEHKYYYDFPGRTQEGLCAYCVSPFVRGLYEMYSQTNDSLTLDLLKASISWFSGENLYGVKLYDNEAGRCLDGLHAGKASTHAGAESAIEAGFCEVRRLLIELP